MTEASKQALIGMRDFSTIQWYVIPLLVIVMYIYISEISEAKKSKNWNIVLAGLALFGADFLNETVNGWIFSLSSYSALWTAPGPSALRTMIGWNIEIMFMFAIAGIMYAKSIDPADVKILGIPNRWFWAIGYSVFAVFVECILNVGNHLVWEYSFWNRSFGGIWLIFIFGYLWFFVFTKFVIELKTAKAKLTAIGSVYLLASFLNIVGMYFLGFIY